MSPRARLGQISCGALIVLGLCGAGGGGGGLHAQGAAAVAPVEIRPTVTEAEGDTGGHYFDGQPDPARTRHYYVAAEPEIWDYAPSGKDEVCGLPLPAPLVLARRSPKVRYVEYTDATFQTRVYANPSLGLLGPVLRGVVGDWLKVTFLNRTDQPLSMHPHGVRYDKDSEGAYYRPGPGRGAAVGAGATFTYVWYLDEDSGPMPDEPSSKAWLYHSHVAPQEETNLGLVGFIIVTDPNRARADGTPNDVDREFGALFMIFDESGLGAEAKEAAEYASLPGAAPAALTWTQMQEQVEQGSRFAINGRVFGNLPGIEMNEGERVRWYLFGLGSEQDFHTAHWHGARVIEEGRRRTDVVDLLPATMKVADLVADNPGTWLFHCHVAEHMSEGMFTRMVVYPREVRGADRRPAGSFLGLPEGRQSLHLKRVARSPAESAGADAKWEIEGSATVYEAFAVFNQGVTLDVGGETFVFRPDAHGEARLPGAHLTITNAGAEGVVYGRSLDFRIALEGAAARAAAAAAGRVMKLTLGHAEHVVRLPGPALR